MSDTNIDPAEVSKFNDLAHRWWDPSGDFKPLHDLNPRRASFIDERANLNGKRTLDVGCGGGLLTEEMYRRGAKVTGIDAGEAVIRIAELHQSGSGTEVDYQNLSAKQLLTEQPQTFDVVTCLELLEHVPEPAELVATCAALVRPGGDVFFSTINRNPKAWLMAIVGAEYVLRLLPKGTHEYRRFIRPSELEEWARSAGLRLQQTVGMRYNPFNGEVAFGRRLDVNYLAWFKRPE